MRARLVIISVLLSVAPVVNVYRDALEHYHRGLYDRARTEFESLGKSPLYEGYAVLCAGKLNMSDFPELLADYEQKYPGSALTSELHYQAGLNLFDEQMYQQADVEFGKVNQKELGKSEQSQFVFKSGYSNYALGRYPEAKKRFVELESLPVSQYSSPARYAMGFMNYVEKDFTEALEWFGKSVKDPRFEELSSFYIVDCRFMLKDYAYVVDEGVKLYDRLPAERQARLARAISESYLVLGNNALARKYYELGDTASEGGKDSDYFYAGSVMYAVQDYEGAVRNFTRISDKSDSLWQIAAYQLGNSYIQLKDKVSALDAFRSASLMHFDADIEEDAAFNHAKLAFDLNNDGSFFESYLKKYSTSRKGEQIYGYMALARLANRDYAGAIEAYDKIGNPNQEEDRNYLKANYLRANQLVSAGAYSDALPFLRSATVGVSAHDPFCQLSKFWIAECQYRTGDFKEAYSGFTGLYNISALDGKPEGDILPYNIGYSAFKQGNYDSASKWFERSLPYLDAGRALDARERKADCFLGLKDYDSAIEAYQKVIDAMGGDKYIYPYFQKAICYGLDGDNKKKAETLKLVEDFPASATLYGEALYELGRTWLDLKENSKAISVFRKLRDRAVAQIDVARGLIGEGMACVNLKRYDEALGCYKTVVADYPGSEFAEDALLAIESVYRSKKEPQKYVEYLEKNGLTSGKTGNEKENLYFNAGEQNFTAGNYEQARISLEKYLNLFPEGKYLPEVWYYLAECMRQQGDKMGACDAFRKASEIGKDASYAEQSLQGYADLCLELERFDAAYDTYSELVSRTSFDERRKHSYRGMMNAAYGARRYDDALYAADKLADNSLETKYVIAKSLLATSQRTDALEMLGELAGQPDTPQGAEACYLLIQDSFERGRFGEVSDKVYAFSPKAGGQNYWLARAFITLGDSFVETGNLQQARTTYESVRDGYSSDDPSDDIQILIAERLGRLDSLNR